MGQKGPETGWKWGFSSFMKNQFVNVFCFFCIKLQQHKGLTLSQMIFWEKSCTGFFWAKRDPKIVFYILKQIDALNFSEDLY